MNNPPIFFNSLDDHNVDIELVNKFINRAKESNNSVSILSSTEQVLELLDKYDFIIVSSLDMELYKPSIILKYPAKLRFNTESDN